MYHEHDVLLQDGYFRLVRLIKGGMIIQHEHTTEPKVQSVHSWDKWAYCYDWNNRCGVCQTKIPKEMQGIKNMVEWEN